jgi:hypothetical protein
MQKCSEEQASHDANATLSDPFGQRFSSIEAATNAKRDWLLSRHSSDFWEKLKQLKERP